LEEQVASIFTVKKISQAKILLEAGSKQAYMLLQ
jgi:hypothetical protein